MVPETVQRGKTEPKVPRNTHIKPSMNLWSVTAMGIGAMVGAGIFALLGEVMLAAGDQTYVSFLLGGVIAGLSGYSYAKLAARYPDAGGPEIYFNRAFGLSRLSGTLSLIYLLTIAATIALVAKAFGAYAQPLLFGNTNALSINGFASGITVLAVLLNIVGSNLVGRAELALVAIKLVILAGLMFAGGYSMISDVPVTHATPHLSLMISSVGLTFLAYAGFSMMTNAGGEVSNPRQTIPRAIYLAIGIVIVFYVGLAFVVVGSVPVVDLAHHADTAVAEAARPVLGQAGYIIVSVGALLATASAVNAWVFTGMQMSLAMAHAGQLPRLFGRLLWGKGSQGVLLGVAVILFGINVFDLNELASVASATFLISYMAVHAAHWQLVSETKGLRLLIGAGFLSMAAVLAMFLWTTALAQPWAVALIVIFVACSWAIELLLVRSGPASDASV